MAAIDEGSGNPLLDFEHLARFDAIQPPHISPAVDSLLTAARAAVAKATAEETPATWDAVVEPLDEALEHLGRAWGAVSHMNAVVDTPALREQYNANLPKLTAFWTELSQNEALYAKYKAIAARPDAAVMPPSRRKVIANELRDFRLGGAELAPPHKARLREIRERQSALSTRFAENVLDATNDFALYLDTPAQLAGVPPDQLLMYREAAANEEHTGYKVTLHFPSYYPVMQYANDRDLRARLHRAYSTRASESGKPDWDNSATMAELLQLRQEQARLIGFRMFAELSLEPKMASSPDEVMTFLRDLARRSKPHAMQDMQELRDFAARELNLPTLEAWDLAFASEKLREARYAYSEHELKQYFPEPKVLAGLFKVIETLFSVAIR
ncbi:MAG TPA: M3 family metallopeptidase, partial [Burkholderiaceae bacterium]|nr:M3 family metallopeptidase [Burkholderiaceae bacterium]